MKRLKLLVIPLLAALLVGCDTPLPQNVAPATAPVREIKVAYDPSKSALFAELLSAYNARAQIKVTGVSMENPDMADAIAKGGLVGVSPDSSIWMEKFDQTWQAAGKGESSVIGTTVRYATTPVVIATWRGREGDLGAPAVRGWTSLLAKASKDPNYKWSHGSPRASASGLLALTAEFYTGSGKTFGLSKADADQEGVRTYVAGIEKTVARYGGESDAALVDYLLQEGSRAVSAVVMPEASVFDFNSRTRGERLSAVSPAEGTLMLDHPLILVETPTLGSEQRKAFLDFGRFLTGSDGQAIVAKHGFRPVDLTFDMEKSPLKAQGIPVDQPKLLQMPSRGVLAYLKDSWALGLKRRANIILVVDTSGSMAGDKLTSTKDALNSFLKQIPSDEERVGLVAFASDLVDEVKLDRLGSNRSALLDHIDQLRSNGNTAFYYAVWYATQTLAKQNDKERINVVVAMTDGLENESNKFVGRDSPGLGRVPAITGSGRDPAPLMRQLSPSGVLLFTVGYGGDADMDSLGRMSSALGGRAYRADPDTIRKLYELISQNF
jgi:Ca-activated chloride channel family protein